MFLLCYIQQSTPFLSKFMRFSISAFWSSWLFCFALDDWHPLYPLSKLMWSYFSIVFRPFWTFAYFFILFLSSHSNPSQVAPLSKLCCSSLSLTLIVRDDGNWRPLFHFFQLSPLFELCGSFLSLSTLVATSNGDQHPILSFLSTLSSLWCLLFFFLFQHSHNC
jgi:hypothetical protein